MHWRASEPFKPVPSRNSEMSVSALRERRILDVLMALQPGEVVTYGDIAEVAGYPKLSRLVGHILATTDVEVPWWRVVNSTGRLVPGHARKQTTLLREEDVIVRKGHVRSAPHGRFSEL
jgi:methylated-DNA-protein-cysteine methyltransferase related protein